MISSTPRTVGLWIEVVQPSRTRLISGIVARLRVVHQSRYRPLWTVDVSGAEQQRLFIEKVGAFGPRVEPAQRLLGYLDSIGGNPNVDTLPIEMFEQVRQAMAGQGVTRRQMARLRGTSYGGSSHFRFAPSRATMSSYAQLLNTPVLQDAVDNDLFWDRIVALEPDGEALLKTLIGVAHAHDSRLF